MTRPPRIDPMNQAYRQSPLPSREREPSPEVHGKGWGEGGMFALAYAPARRRGNTTSRNAAISAAGGAKVSSGMR